MGKTERIGITQSDSKSKGKKTKALTNTQSPKFGIKQESTTTQQVSEQIQDFNKFLALGQGKGMHTMT